MLHLSLNTENKTKQKKTTDACWLQPTFVVKENGWAWRGVCQLLTYHCMVWCAEVNLPIPATASFVLGREHVVHKAETNPPEYHQLYTTYASRLAHNTHSKKNNTFLLEHKTRIAARAPIPIIFKPLMRIVMILSPGCVCIHLFLAVRWVHWFTGLVLLAHCQKVLRYKPWTSLWCCMRYLFLHFWGSSSSCPQFPPTTQRHAWLLLLALPTLLASGGSLFPGWWIMAACK